MEELVRTQLTVATSLHRVLLDENNALKARDADRIKALSEEKIQLTSSLEQLASQQGELLAAKGLTLSAEGLNDYARQLPDGRAAGFNAAVKKLNEVLAQSKQQNQVNGQMIAATRQSVEVALSILRGQNGSQELTYGPGGETRSNPGSGSLAKA